MTRDLDRRLTEAERALSAATGRPVIVRVNPGESRQAAIRRAGAETAPTVILLERNEEPYPNDSLQP